jgi:hypothetical protein
MSANHLNADGAANRQQLTETGAFLSFKTLYGMSTLGGSRQYAFVSVASQSDKGLASSLVAGFTQSRQFRACQAALRHGGIP